MLQNVMESIPFNFGFRFIFFFNDKQLAPKMVNMGQIVTYTMMIQVFRVFFPPIQQRAGAGLCMLLRNSSYLL